MLYVVHVHALGVECRLESIEITVESQKSEVEIK